MESKSTLIQNKRTGSFIEPACTIEFNGHEFTSGGAFIAKRIDTNKYEGCVYAVPESSEVTSWDGTIRIKAHFGKPYRHNFGGHFQHVWFSYNGIQFHGKYGCDWSQLVRVHQVNS